MGQLCCIAKEHELWDLRGKSRACLRLGFQDMFISKEDEQQGEELFIYSRLAGQNWTDMSKAMAGSERASSSTLSATQLRDCR